MTVQRLQHYLTGDHWSIIFDYLDINSLVTLCRTITLFQTQLRPKKAPLDNDPSKSEVYGYSTYLTKRLLHALLSMYRREDGGMKSVDDILACCIPSVVRKNVEGDTVELVFKTFQTVRHVMLSMESTALSIPYKSVDNAYTQQDHIPILVWSLDKDCRLRHVMTNAERYLHFHNDTGSLPYPEDVEANLHNAKKGNLPNPFYSRGAHPMSFIHPATEDSPTPTTTLPDFLIPLDAAIIMYHFSQYISDLSHALGDSDKDLNLTLFHPAPNENTDWPLGDWDRTSAPQGRVPPDWEGGYFLTDKNELKTFICIGTIGTDDHHGTLLIDCTLQTPSTCTTTYGAIYHLDTFSQTDRGMYLFADSLTDFVAMLVEGLEVGPSGFVWPALTLKEELLRPEGYVPPGGRKWFMTRGGELKWGDGVRDRMLYERNRREWVSIWKRHEEFQQ
ncbi:hypothetical protein HDV00_008074 [Rhizophlyctis rosea]|nr:hypothetical protein HDV00_008074 [Rhizophlyctis rosea]